MCSLCLQAPGLYAGYAPQALPGVHHALREGDWAEAQAQADACAERIRAAAGALAGPGQRPAAAPLVLVV